MSTPGIYNALDYGLLLADSSGGVTNANAIQRAINAAVSDNGGIVLIPATDETYATGFYQIAFDDTISTISIPATGELSNPLLICGTANATRLVVETDGATLFTINGNSWTTFADLTIQWDQQGGAVSGEAFSFQSGSGENEGYRLFRVNVVDCQKPVSFLAGSVATLLECNLDYTDAYPTTQPATGILVDNFNHLTVENCSLSLSSATPGSIGIYANNTVSAASIAYLRVVGTSISMFDTGISIVADDGAGTILGPMFSDLDITTTGPGINIQGTNLFDASFVNCMVQPASPQTGPGISIGTAGLANSQIDTVRFLSCTVTGFSGNGLQIAQGRNIQVIGGSYSGNGEDGGAGIAITGAPTEIQMSEVNCCGPSAASSSVQQYGIAINAGQDIQISGANCSGTGSSSYPGSGIIITSSYAAPSDIRILGATCIGQTLGEEASAQQYGISLADVTSAYVDNCTLGGSISGGCGILISASKNVFVDNCDCSANPYGVGVTSSCQGVYIDGCNLNFCATGPLYLSSPGTLQVVNCPGYNDQATTLATGGPGSGSTFNSTHFSYYGPIAFFVANTAGVTVTQIDIDGANTHLLSGGFTLNAPAPSGSTYTGEMASITYSPPSGAGTPYFLAVGK